MEVCEVCGAFLIVGDAQQRIDDHLMGKQHVGLVCLKFGQFSFILIPGLSNNDNFVVRLLNVYCMASIAWKLTNVNDYKLTPANVYLENEIFLLVKQNIFKHRMSPFNIAIW